MSNNTKNQQIAHMIACLAASGTTVVRKSRKAAKMDRAGGYTPCSLWVKLANGYNIIDITETGGFDGCSGPYAGPPPKGAFILEAREQI